MGVFDSIDKEWLSHDPAIDLYPLSFSPSCKDVWERCVNETIKDTRLESCEEKWMFCVTKFIDSCYMDHREPFAEPAETVNDVIIEQLKAQYREVVSFLTKLPCEVAESKLPKCFLMDTGFCINLEYTFSYTQSSFHDDLVNIGFKQSEIGYEYSASKGASILLQNIKENPESIDGSARVSLICQKQPIIADNYIPSHSQLSDFILSVLFDTVKKISNPLKG